MKRTKADTKKQRVKEAFPNKIIIWETWFLRNHHPVPLLALQMDRGKLYLLGKTACYNSIKRLIKAKMTRSIAHNSRRQRVKDNVYCTEGLVKGIRKSPRKLLLLLLLQMKGIQCAEMGRRTHTIRHCIPPRLLMLRQMIPKPLFCKDLVMFTWL